MKFLFIYFKIKFWKYCVLYYLFYNNSNQHNRLSDKRIRKCLIFLVHIGLFLKNNYFETFLVSRLRIHYQHLFHHVYSILFQRNNFRKQCNNWSWWYLWCLMDGVYKKITLDYMCRAKFSKIVMELILI